MRKVTVSFVRSDSGLCRDYYKNKLGLYCLQKDVSPSDLWYLCSKDGEPQTPLYYTQFFTEDGTQITERKDDTT
jgi:hypothetical protein